MPQHFRLALVLFFVGLFFGAASAEAGVIFKMTGTCSYFCGSTGQNSGDPISGFVEFNNFDTAANGSFLVPDDYDLIFGNIELTPTSADYFLKSPYNQLQKIDATTIGPHTFDVWSATENVPIIYLGDCYGCSASTWAYGFAPGSTGTFAFTRETPLAAPEPMSVALLGTALAGLGLMRRRRRC